MGLTNAQKNSVVTLGGLEEFKSKLGSSDSNVITSTTKGLKIEVVTSMPSSPNANTIYIVK